MGRARSAGSHVCSVSGRVRAVETPARCGAPPQVLQLLGKLGARNRRWLKAPQAVAYRENPEHGLRIVLTFHPATSFLVPLDRCLSLVRGAVCKPDAGVPVEW